MSLLDPAIQQDPRVIVVQPPPSAAPPAPAAPVPGEYLTKEQAFAMMEQARKEEKDKLYPEIERINGELRTLTQEREAQESERLRVEQEAAESARREQESRMTAEELIARNNQDWEAKFSQMNREREQDRALLEKERQYGENQTYIARRVKEEIENHSLAPELAVHVSGETIEQIEASIQRFQSTTAQIAESIASATPPSATPPMPRLPGSGIPPVDMLGGGDGGLGSQEQVTLTPEDIRSMSMEEYGQYRNNLMAAASQRARSGGLYQP